MPWAELDYRWNANFVNMKDYDGGVVALHDKFWKTGPEKLRELWQGWKERMEEYHNCGTLPSCRSTNQTNVRFIPKGSLLGRYSLH
jgi:hypothetical protein